MKKRPKTLPPIIYKDSWHSELAKLLTTTLKELIFDPLFEIFETEMHQNAKESALYAAIKSGKINYTNGRFIGKFNASINKEIKLLGGKFKRGEWVVARDKLPAMLVNLIEANRKKTERIYAALEAKLDTAKSKINSILKNLDLESIGVKGMDKVSVEFKKTVGKNLAVQPQLDQKGIRQIYTEYLKSTELPIKQRIWREYRDTTIDYTENFAQEEVERLRVDLKEIILAGAPRDYARTAINHHLGLSKARCKFIARQETALLTTEFKKALYCQTGITKYKWRTNHDHKVRKRHVELDGKTFDWNVPIVVSDEGQKVMYGYPGTCYNCRCQALPIVGW
jgi:SPP1 gp7 family putative phage head morphogenesis protein